MNQTAPQTWPKPALTLHLRQLLIWALLITGGFSVPPPPSAAHVPHTATAVADCPVNSDSSLLDGFSQLTFPDTTALGPERPLRLGLHIGNLSDQSWQEITVRVQATRAPLRSHNRLNRWLDGSAPADTTIFEEELERQLNAKQKITHQLTVPSKTIATKWRPRRWGPHGIQVDVLADGVVQTSSRTVVQWNAKKPAKLTPAKIALFTPLVAPSVDISTGRTHASALHQAHHNQGHLAEQLAIARLPGAIWLLDPALIDPEVSQPATTLLPAKHQAALITATKSTPEETKTIQTWQQKVLETTANHDVLLLPYLNPDVPALVAADTAPVLTAATTLAAETWTAATQKPQPQLATNLDRTNLTKDHLLAVSSAGMKYAIIPAGQLHPDESATSTNSPQRPELKIHTAGRDLTTIQNHTTFANLLAPLNTNVPLECQTNELGAVPSPGTVTASTLAHLAITAQSATHAEKPQVLTLPAQWIGQPQTLLNYAQAILTASWTAPVSLTELTPKTSEKASIDSDAELRRVRKTLPATELRDAQRAIDALRPTLEMAAIPDQNYPDRLLAAISSQTWLPGPDQWLASQEKIRHYSRAVNEAVRVLPSSSYNIVSSDVNLPLTVINDLNYPVNVLLAITATNSRLRPSPPSPLMVPAQSKRVAKHSMTAVSDGDVTIAANITTLSGITANEGQEVPIRIRRFWQSGAVVGTCVVLGGLVLLGIVRGIRKDRRHHTVKGTA